MGIKRKGVVFSCVLDVLCNERDGDWVRFSASYNEYFVCRELVLKSVDICW